MKQDASWTMVSTSYNPLKLYRLIQRVVLKQTKDQYPFIVVLEQSSVLNTKKGGLSNTQWYKRFNTQHDVALSVGVELGHKALWEYCAQSKHSMSYDMLGTTNQAVMHQATEDQYLAYVLLPMCAQFCYAYRESPYVIFFASLPVRIRGLPVCVQGPGFVLLANCA